MYEMYPEMLDDATSDYPGRELARQRRIAATQHRRTTESEDIVSVDAMLGELIAEREYEATDSGGGNPRRVLLRVGKPRPDSRLGGAWVCPIQIVGFEHDYRLNAAGVDAVQALYLAMTMAGARLTHAPGGLKVTWLGGTDLGLPLPPA